MLLPTLISLLEYAYISDNVQNKKIKYNTQSFWVEKEEHCHSKKTGGRGYLLGKRWDVLWKIRVKTRNGFEDGKEREEEEESAHELGNRDSLRLVSPAIVVALSRAQGDWKWIYTIPVYR